MNLLWPEALWSLLLVPLLVALYFWLLRRKRQAFRLASVAIARQALGRGTGWRRHLPPLVMLLALATLLLATARPTAMITLPLGSMAIRIGKTPFILSETAK